MGYPGVRYRNRGVDFPTPANDNTPLRRSPSVPDVRRPYQPPAPANDNERRLAGLVRRARPYYRVAMRAARVANRVRMAWDVYRRLQYWYDIEQQMARPVSNGVVDLPSGWSIQQTCCSLPEVGISRNYLWVICDPACAVFPAGGARNGEILATDTVVGGWHWDGISYYTNDAPMVGERNLYVRNTGTEPFRYRRDMPFAVPEVSPAVDPFSLPVGAPRVNYKPLRWVDTPLQTENPWRSPSEQSQRGYGVPGARPGVGLVELHSVELTPGGNPSVRPGPRHKPADPGPGKRELKLQARRGVAFRLTRGVRDLAYATTEALDALQAIEGALPRHLRAPRGSTPQERLAAVLRNYRSIDVREAILRLVANQIVDAVIGRTIARGQAGANQLRLGFIGRSIVDPAIAAVARPLTQGVNKALGIGER